MREIVELDGHVWRVIEEHQWTDQVEVTAIGSATVRTVPGVKHEQVTLLKLLDSEADEARRKLAAARRKAASDPEVGKALSLLFDLEAELPDDKRAVVAVRPDGTFEVEVVAR